MRSLVFLIFAKNNKGIFNLPYDIIQNIMMPHIYFKNERCTLMSIFEYFFYEKNRDNSSWQLLYAGARILQICD